MAGISIQRSGFTRIPELFASIVTDLVANGFTQQFPSAALTPPAAGTPYPTFKATLEASATIDPLNATQAWRIQLEAKADQIGNIYIAAPLQLQDDGTVALLELAANAPQGVTALPAGMINGKGTMPSTQTSGSG